MTIVIDLAASFFVVTLLFATIFKFLPDARILWRNVGVGALLTGILFTVGKFGLTLYFKFGSSTSAYGAAGSLAAVLIWVYYSAQLVFFGAEFTRVYAEATGHQIVPDDHAVTMGEQQRIAHGIAHNEVAQAAAASSPSAPDRRPTATPNPRQPTRFQPSSANGFGGAKVMAGVAAARSSPILATTVSNVPGIEGARRPRRVMPPESCVTGSNLLKIS